MIDGIASRDRGVLARLITRIDDGFDPTQLFAALPMPAQPAHVFAITGAGGVGKSTLVGALVRHLVKLNLRVAVLACDPASERTGGALLGDRIRMDAADNVTNGEAFIRSLSSRGGEGGLSDSTGDILQLLRCFGFDVILLETIGIGQDQVAARRLADSLVLVISPDSGDHVQWDKAGVAEWANLIVLNKADLPGASKTRAMVYAAIKIISVTGGSPPGFVAVSAVKEDGIDALWQRMDALPPRLADADAAADRAVRRLHRALDEWLTQPAATVVLHDLAAGTITPAQAMSRLFA